MKSVVSDPLKAAASTVAGRLAGRCAPLQKTIHAAENCYDDIFTRRNQLPQGHGGEDEKGTRVIQAVQQDVKSKFRTAAKVVTVVHRFDGGTKRLSAVQERRQNMLVPVKAGPAPPLLDYDNELSMMEQQERKEEERFDALLHAHEQQQTALAAVPVVTLSPPPATAKSSAPAPAPVGVTPEHLQVQGAGANLCNGAYDLIANISGKSAFATTTTDNRQIKLFWMPPAKAWSISGAGKYLPFYGLIRTSNCSSFDM